MPEDILSSTTPGFFGKVPVRGDFITRRLPHDFVTPWDAWIRKSLVSSRETLGRDWLDAYLTCPVWRFALSGNLCGANARAGVFLPSVDRIGRYYPFTLATDTADISVNPNIFTHSDDWFREAESLALTCLSREFSLPEFDARVTQLSPLTSFVNAHNAVATLESHSGVRGWRVTSHDTTSPAPAFSSVLPDLLASALAPCSVWWTGGSERVQAALLVYDALPPPEHFCAIIGGDWQRGSDPPTRRHQAFRTPG